MSELEQEKAVLRKAGIGHYVLVGNHRDMVLLMLHVNSPSYPLMRFYPNGDRFIYG